MEVLKGLGSALVLTGLLRLFWWRRARREIARLREQNAVEAERARIARDIHDDLGSALSRISMLSQFLDLEKTKREEAIESLRRINLATQKMARAMDEIVWALNPRNDQTDHLLTFFASYAQEFLASTHIDFRCKYPEAVPEWPVDTATRHNLFLAFKEALTNAVRHARCRSVEMEARISENRLALTITDDGIGFAKTGPAGNGLGNMRQRMEYLGGTFSITSVPGRGTTVAFGIPRRKQNV